MAEYNRRANLFLLRGMNITLPGDRIGKEYAQLIRNIRPYRVGEWQQRPGLRLIADVDNTDPQAVLFERRITHPITGAYRRIVGLANGDVYVDDATHTTFTVEDSGYNGGPLASAIARPDRSPLPYMFVANGDRISKFDTQGDRTNWGLITPVVPPVAELAPLPYTVIDDCFSATGFVGSGGAVSLVDRIPTTAITYILYDTGTDGWACVVPASFSVGYQEGARITVSDNPETVIIESIYPEIASTTVGSIAYDVGSTGLCTIQPAVPTLGLQRNMILRLAGSENVRVIDVTPGVDGVPSFRCSTVGTIVATDTIVGFQSFRAYFNNTHAAAANLDSDYIQLAVAGSGLATLNKVAALDLSQTTEHEDRPIQPQDYIHISLLVSDFTQVTEVQLQFDCDETTNDFTQNYYFKSIRQPDLQAAYSQTASSITAQQQELQRQQIDDYRRQQLEEERRQLENANYGVDAILNTGMTSWAQTRLAEIDDELGGGFLSPTGAGSISLSATGGESQWTEFTIPISQFQRVGSDTSRNWQNIEAFRVTVQAAGSVDVGIAALWIGGTYGADFTTGDPLLADTSGPQSGYNWIYRARRQETGSRSSFSPPLRSAILPHREAIQLIVPGTYPDPQADVFDFFRIGGTLAEYHYVGTCPVSEGVFIDTIPDDMAVRNEIADFNRFQPWIVSDLPKSGVGDITGTTLTLTSGDTLDLDYVRGNQIIIGNQIYTFYTKPDSTTVIQLNESGGSQTGVPWEIPEPSVEAQPLPFVFGPYGGSTSGEFIFGLGDPRNPGYLYWTTGNDPESCPDTGYLELSNPSEPLIGGAILDGIAYVWSDRRSWRILPSFQGGQSGAGSAFYFQETAMGKGLVSPWALASGDRLYFISWDGVYASRGDAIESLTDDSMAPLFHKDGQPISGTPYSTLPSISFAEADRGYLYLTYSKDGIYVGYKGTDGLLYTIFYSFLTQGWVRDTYSPSQASRIVREEGPQVDEIIVGTQTANLLTFDSTLGQDDGSEIPCEFISRAENWDDDRAPKQIGDIFVDYDSRVNGIAMTLIYDTGNVSEVLTPLVPTPYRLRAVRDINDGAGTLKLNVALQLFWPSQAGAPTRLYGWEPSALIKPEITNLRATDWTNDGYVGPKWLQGVRIVGDTFGRNKSVRVQYDGGQTADVFTINLDGENTHDQSWVPIVAHQMRLIGERVGTDWRLMQTEWIWEPEPSTVTVWEMQFSSMDLPGFFHVREVLIAHRSSQDFTLTVYVDETFQNSYTIPAGGVGVRAKTYLPLVAHKGKLWKFRITSDAGVALYAKDIEVKARAWGQSGPYQTFRPFGDVTRTNGGARI